MELNPGLHSITRPGINRGLKEVDGQILNRHEGKTEDRSDAQAANLALPRAAEAIHLQPKGQL